MIITIKTPVALGLLAVVMFGMYLLAATTYAEGPGRLVACDTDTDCQTKNPHVRF